MPVRVPSRKLADGTDIPVLGLGVWQVPNGKQTEQAVRWALEAGYRHVDTAQAYGNEASVGRAIRDSGLPREEIFLTTKFYPGSPDPVAAIEESLGRLAMDYVDLYIIHWPERGPTWAWPGMERSQGRGHARSIGVSNFSSEELDQLAAVAQVPAAVNQVELSPFEYRRALLEHCQRDDIAVEAYSPLGTGRHLGDPTVAAVAAEVGRTPAQVLIRWCLQRETIVLPKSTHRERIEQNIAVFDFELSDAQMRTLDGLDTTNRTGDARERKWW